MSKAVKKSKNIETKTETKVDPITASGSRISKKEADEIYRAMSVLRSLFDGKENPQKKTEDRPIDISMSSEEETSETSSTKKEHGNKGKSRNNTHLRKYADKRDRLNNLNIRRYKSKLTYEKAINDRNKFMSYIEAIDEFLKEERGEGSKEPYES